MERAALLLKQNKYSRQILSDDDLVRGIWPLAVGKTIARHTGRISVVRSKLVVEVEDAIWQRQLHALSRQIVDRIQKTMGSTLLNDIEFRIGIPRRQMHREESPRNCLQVAVYDVDEADAIQDPVLKKVYRISRKRATA